MALAWRPALLALLMLAACSTGQSLAPVDSGGPVGFAGWSDAVPPYRLGFGDRVQVKFLLTPEMDEEAQVAPDGTIALRVAGQIQALGLTLPELTPLVERQSQRWLQNPVVSLALKETPSSRVYVGGSVMRPGAYLVNGRLGALEAVLLAGGFDREARFEQVVLIRRNPNNRPMLRTVNLRSFIQTGGGTDEVPLAPGDIVYVPRSSISELNLWIEQFIDGVLPFERGFDYTINRSRPGSPF